MQADWTKATGKELGDAVVSVGRGLWDNDAGRRTRMKANISRYEGVSLPDLSPFAYQSAKSLRSDGPEGEQIRWNLCRSLPDTITAKIAGTQQPKVQFVVSNGSWTMRRKGPKLDALLQGVWSQPQEPFQDIWDLGATLFRDASVCSMGAVKIWSDTEAGRLLHERIFAWELLVDPEDAKYGRPLNLFHVTTYTKAKLLGLFPESQVDIEAAACETDDEIGIGGTQWAMMQGRSVVDSVRCYEWWMLPTGVGSPGRHVLAFDGGVLIDEPWARNEFPFAILRWASEFQGWYARSLIDDIAPIDDEMNDLVARTVRTARLTGMATFFVHEDDTTTDISNEDAMVCRYSGQVPPTCVSASPISPSHIELINMLKGAAYEFSGINQMSATAQKQAGLDSGAAIRTVADLQSERFSIVWRAYQMLFLQIARLDIACIRELAATDNGFAAQWAGRGFLESIDWNAVSLEDDQFTLQMAPAPSIKGTPADRLQTAQELFGSGQLTPDAFLAVRTYLDLPGELERVSRQRSIVDRYIEQWLDATDEELATMKTTDGRDLVPAPLPWMRLEDALLQVVDGYMQAELDGAPDEIKDLFCRWITAVDAEIQKRQQRLAAMQAPPAAPPGQPGAGQPPPGVMAA